MHAFIDNTNELKTLKVKENHVKDLNSAIHWEYSSPYCYEELKSTAFPSREQATQLLSQIKSLEKNVNHIAYAVFESRSHKGMWRVIARLNLIKN